MADISNRERVGRGLEQLRAGLRPYVERELRARVGKNWFTQISGDIRHGLGRDASGKIRWDSSALLQAMRNTWGYVFGQTLGHFERSLVHELITTRNNYAHDETFSANDADRALDSMQRLLKAVAAPEQAKAVRALRMEVQRKAYSAQARSKERQAASTLKSKPLAGLKPWREVVTPHRDVASGDYVEAEFAADLGQIHRGEGSDEYRDPIEFYRRTFITAGLKDLLVDALRRLDGKGGEPAVELQTNFGGGKTHSMMALYHLFGGTRTSDLPGIEPVLQDADVRKAAKAERAVLVGTAMSPGEVSVKEDGTKVRTMWGEMAWQLGGADGFAIIAESDRQSVSPGSQDLQKLFKRYSPCLVLVDEWVAYARLVVGKDDLPAGNFDAQSTFAQALTEAAKNTPETLIVLTVPASKVEIGGEHGKMALDVLENVLERIAHPWRPATADEGFEIVRRRLFEPIRDHASRDAVVDAFARLYRTNEAEFPSGCKERSYRRQLEASYPIHPELFECLYSEWSTLDRFQRTRGVLRLMAQVIQRLWETQDANLLILPSTIPIDDSSVKTEATRYLPDVWEPILSVDVDGVHSLPLELDRKNPNLGRHSACRKVARMLYMATAPGSSSKNPGIDDRRVRLGCVQPGEPAATFGDALRRIVDRAKHIHQDGNRYWISTKTNLNRLAEDRSSDVMREPEEVYEEVVRRLRQEKDRGEFAAVHPCPESTSDVPDKEEARLVILHPKNWHRRGKQNAETPASKAARELLDQRGSSPRLNRNALVFLAADRTLWGHLEQTTAQYLAWKSITSDESLTLDSFQSNQVKTRLTDSDERVDAQIREAWIHALVPDQPQAQDDIEWQALKAAGPDPLARRLSAKLISEEQLLTVYGGIRLKMSMDEYLWGDGNHVSIGKLAEYFPRYIYLPRLRDKNVLLQAIEGGVSLTTWDKDSFAVAEAFDEATGRYQGLRAGELPPQLSDSMLVVRPQVAYEQILQDEDEARRRRGLEPRPADDQRGDESDPKDGDGGGKTESPKPVKPSFFHGSVALDALQIGKQAGQIGDEILKHLAALPGAEVEARLEISAKVPAGVEENVVRVVTENCNALKFDGHGFEDD